MHAIIITRIYCDNGIKSTKYETHTIVFQAASRLLHVAIREKKSLIN